MTRLTDFAPDMIEEILLRLPVKSLLRFKCVSESLNSLISSPAFARMHFERASRTHIFTSTPSGLSLLDFETSFGDEIGLEFPPKRQDHRVRILGSCHGLVAVALKGDNDFFIWNPITGDYKKLPDPCFPPTVKNRNYQSTHGFGYDSSTDDYKLIFFIQRSHCLRLPRISSFLKETMVAIFSLRKNSWRMIQSPPTNALFFPPQNPSGCFVNGALNWLSGKGQSEEILTFDLKTERVSGMPVPNQENIGFIITNMGVLDGRLCLTSCNVLSSPTFFNNFQFFLNEPQSYPVEIWVMEEYGVKKSWTKLLTFVDKYNSWHLPLCISKSKEVILLNDQKDLIRSDAEGSILEKFRICKCDHENFNYCSIFEQPCQAIVYAESLLSPNVNNIEDEQQNQGRIKRRKTML